MMERLLETPAERTFPQSGQGRQEEGCDRLKVMEGAACTGVGRLMWSWDPIAYTL